MADCMVKINNLGKCYKICHQGKSGQKTIRDAFEQNFAKIFKRNTVKNQKNEDFWALENLTFEINRGDRVGIIGRNGAGKSTLLKLLTRITEPTTGSIEIRGKVSSLLEVGTGFHAELSGRENIYLNGTILGMKRVEIKRKFDEIVDFSGVEQFLDTPVKRYSSGMYVRLAFAVASHLESEILIIDEVLAVGDAEFQRKCLGKMDDISKNQGRTLLFVSHNMAAVQSLCNRGIVLHNGKLLIDEGIQNCVIAYQKGVQKLVANKNIADLPRFAHCSGEARIIGFSIKNIDSNSSVINADLPCIAELTFEVFKDNTSVGGEFLISDDIQRLSLFHSYLRSGFVPMFNKGIHKLICRTGPVLLYSGTYYISLGLSRPNQPIDYLEKPIEIEVELPHRNESLYEYKKSLGEGICYIEHQWELA
jgi:lipopolysaccharide transport system ATP-binding protein